MPSTSTPTARWAALLRTWAPSLTLSVEIDHRIQRL
jgi:hypothetical protein